MQWWSGGKLGGWQPHSDGLWSSRPAPDGLAQPQGSVEQRRRNRSNCRSVLLYSDFPFLLLFCHVLAHFGREKMALTKKKKKKCFKWNITNGRRERRGRGKVGCPLLRRSGGGRGQLKETRKMKRALTKLGWNEWWWFRVVDRWRPCLMKAITCSDVTCAHRPFYPNKIKFRRHISFLFKFKGRTPLSIEVKVAIFSQTTITVVWKIRHLRESGVLSPEGFAEMGGRVIGSKWRPLRDKMWMLTDWGRRILLI